MALRGSVRQQGIGMEGTDEVITSEREEREGDEEKEREREGDPVANPGLTFWLAMVSPGGEQRLRYARGSEGGQDGHCAQPDVCTVPQRPS